MSAFVFVGAVNPAGNGETSNTLFTTPVAQRLSASIEAIVTRRAFTVRGPRFTPPALMNLSRFESFSDAVFAIAITLLVLNFRIPELPTTAGDSQTVHRLLSLWPDFLGYVTSFIVIGVLWVNHHALFHFLRRVDRFSLVIKLLLLMCVAFIPFPTALIARYGRVVPVVILFGLTMAITGMLFSALWFYAVRMYLKTERQIDGRFVRDASLWIIGYPVAYLAATAASLVNTRISLALYIAIPMLYLLPGVIDRQLHSNMYERKYGRDTPCVN
ncbi:MAG: TMEM175 family protein [Vulcanimicrobiaceae bacterium]